jgi:hypothetical protein
VGARALATSGPEPYSSRVTLDLQLQPERAFLRGRSSVAIRELPGFLRGRHRLPTEHGRGGEEFVHALGEAPLSAEIREVYERAKRVLGLRRRDLVQAVAPGGGNVDAPQFQFALELGLDPGDFTSALWQRRVVLLVGPARLPGDFDEVFPVGCDELIVPFHGDQVSFDVLVERLEDFAQLHGGEVAEDQAIGRTSLATADGSRIALDLTAGELSLRFVGVAGVRELLLEAQRRHAELAEPIVSALDRRR